MRSSARTAEPSPLDNEVIQQYCCNVLPPLVSISGSPWPVLPPGVHEATLDTVATTFATNAWRRRLFNGLVEAARLLRAAGCSTIYLDGSYVTGKPLPADFDACWDPFGINETVLDKVFLEFGGGRRAQKARFGGEFFPSSMTCSDVGDSFLNFLQLDRFTGQQKGILLVSLLADSILLQKVQP